MKHASRDRSRARHGREMRGSVERRMRPGPPPDGGDHAVETRRRRSRLGPDPAMIRAVAAFASVRGGRRILEGSVRGPRPYGFLPRQRPAARVRRIRGALDRLCRLRLGILLLGSRPCARSRTRRSGGHATVNRPRSRLILFLTAPPEDDKRTVRHRRHHPDHDRHRPPAHDDRRGDRRGPSILFRRGLAGIGAIACRPRGLVLSARSRPPCVRPVHAASGGPSRGAVRQFRRWLVLQPPGREGALALSPAVTAMRRLSITWLHRFTIRLRRIEAQRRGDRAFQPSVEAGWVWPGQSPSTGRSSSSRALEPARTVPSEAASESPTRLAVDGGGDCDLLVLEDVSPGRSTPSMVLEPDPIQRAVPPDARSDGDRHVVQWSGYHASGLPTIRMR